MPNSGSHHTVGPAAGAERPARQLCPSVSPLVDLPDPAAEAAWTRQGRSRSVEIPPAAGVITDGGRGSGAYLSQGARWASGVAAHWRPRPRVLPAPSSASTIRMAA